MVNFSDIKLSKYAQAIEALGIFSMALLLFTVGLGQQEIIGFEARFYLFALEMWRHGPTWFPTTYSMPYPDYPVTSTLLIYWSAKLFGGLSKFTAIFPSAMAAAMTVAMTYLTGALHSRMWGWCAVFFMLLTNTFVMEARTISPDQYITLVTVICFYLAYSATIMQYNKRLWFIPLLLLFGFACRGPIGLVVPAGVLSVFYLLNNNIKQFFVMALIALLVLMVGCVVLFGAAYHVGGISFMQDVLHLQVLGRLQDAYLAWYFYFVESLGAYAITYPLAIMIVAGLGLKILNPRSAGDLAFMQKLLAWALVIIIGLTIPAGKKIRYILAFTPALALLCAYLFVMPRQNKYFNALRASLYWLCYFLPLIFLMGVLAIQFYAPQKQFDFNISYSLVSIIFLLLQTLNLVNRKWELAVLGVGAVAFVLAYITVVEPINLALNQTRNFVEKIELQRHFAHAQLVFYRESSDGMPIKYIVNMPREDRLLFADKPEELMQFKSGTVFIASPEHFTEIPAQVKELLVFKEEQNIGHDPVVVFQKK